MPNVIPGYPYTNDFPETERKFELVYTPVQPERVAQSSNVRHPDAMLNQEFALFKPVTGDAWAVVDFGRETVGTVDFAVKARGNCELRVYYGEDLTEALRDEPFTCGWYTLAVDRFELSEGIHRMRNNGRRGFRFVRFVVSGSEVEIGELSATLVHYPVSERGYFSCSDPLLNRIWDLSTYTTKICMQQYYEDGLKRDGMLWIGDYRIQFLCNAFPFGDIDLARKSLFMMAASQREDGSMPACTSSIFREEHERNIDYMPGIPEAPEKAWTLVNYLADFVSCLPEYALYTGDTQTLTRLWPYAARVLEYLSKVEVDQLQPGRNYLIDKLPNTGQVWWGSESVLIMQMLWAFRDGQALAERFSEPGVTALCASNIKRISEQLHRDYFDHSSGLFSDVRIGSERSISHHASAFAALSGLVENRDDRTRLLLRALEMEDAHYPIRGMSSFWVNEALFENGLTTQALESIRAYHGGMLERGATTTWEELDIHTEKPPITNHPVSLCHAWTAGPAYHLPTYVLGIRPLNEGWDRLRVSPSLGDLDWAEGGVILPTGELYVRWEAGDEVRGYIEAPEGVEVEVEVNGRVRRLGAGKYSVI